MAKIKTISSAPGASSLMPKMARRPGFSNTRMPAVKSSAAKAMSVKMPKMKMGMMKSPKTKGLKIY